MIQYKHKTFVRSASVPSRTVTPSSQLLSSRRVNSFAHNMPKIRAPNIDSTAVRLFRTGKCETKQRGRKNTSPHATIAKRKANIETNRTRIRNLSWTTCWYERRRKWGRARTLNSTVPIRNVYRLGPYVQFKFIESEFHARCRFWLFPTIFLLRFAVKP